MAGTGEGSDAARLLALLAGESSNETFQTFDESPAKRKHLAKKLYGTLQNHWPTLLALNAEGASVNFMVNQGDGKDRTSANVTRVRALFVDLDGSPMQPVLDGPLAPHATVESSPGKGHAYWLVEGVALNDFKRFQQALALKFKGDTKVSDLGRVMRLPGTLHQKGEAQPCKLLSLHEWPPYTRRHVVEAFGLDQASVAPSPSKLTVADGSIAVGERNSRLFELARSFVNKGFTEEQVLDRIQLVNVRKCEAPLCASEVDKIVSSAVTYGPSGYLNLPVRVFDSLAYRGLSHAARTIAATAYRRYNGENNGNIALPFSDFQIEFSRRQSFYGARAEVVAAGLIRLVQKRRYNEWGGRHPDLYEIVLSPPSGPIMERSAGN
ncbi:MAG: DNA-primase RepB domain-containing protein [Thermomonas sp.]